MMGNSNGVPLRANRAASTIFTPDSPGTFLYTKSVWEVREGDTVSLPADPARCPDCSETLVLVAIAGRQHGDTVPLTETRLYCPHPGCDTDLVSISNTACDPVSPA